MKKRILSALLCLCIVFGLVPVTVWAATRNGHTHYLCGGSACNGSGHENESSMTTFAVEIVQNGSTLKIGGKAWTSTTGSLKRYELPAGTYYLGSDITPEYSVMIKEEVTLCLNGHTIRSIDTSHVIELGDKAIFNLTDCKQSGTADEYGELTHASGKSGRGVYVYKGTFNMYGGSITGNKTERGGGVYVDTNGTFNMYGGTITGNSATGDGGGVYVIGSNSKFTMTGGSIGGTATNDANQAKYGGGVYVSSGTFTMSGGTITGNKVSYSYGDGGGVFVNYNGTFNMSDDSRITGNTAFRGGGVCVERNLGGNNNKPGNFAMSGGTIGGMTDADANSAQYGGGVYVMGTFTLTGGEISGNNAKGVSGGVYVNADSTFTVSGAPKITNNTQKTTTSSNVYLTEGPGGKPGAVIVIGDAHLDSGAEIGVTLDSNYGDKAFTSGWNAKMGDNNPSNYFISDVGGKGFEQSNGEVKLCDGHTHYLCGGSTCNGSGHEAESSATVFAKEIKQEGDKLYIGDTEWLAGDRYALSAGSYCLSTDLTLDAGIKITGNVTLCLNGHSITANHDGDVIAVNSGATFTLTDCKGGNSDAAFGKITHASGKDGRGVYVSNRNATFNMYGGSIADNNMVTDDYVGNDEVGGGVYIAGDDATFNMYDGTICGNTAGSSGGGVYMTEKANFNLYGGAICGNTATRNLGGGVCVYKNGNFNMSGGEINDNGTRCGGGVYVGDSSTFTITGGSITGNNVSVWRAGGGIYISGSAKKFTVSGNIQITGNMKTGTKNENGKYTGGTVENLYLLAGETITVGGVLTEGAKLGVTLANNYGDNAFTSGWNANMSGKTPSDYFTSDTDGYVAKLNGSELKMVSTHVHEWTYTASGDTITATCKNCSDNGGEDYSGGTAIITASDATYNGNPNRATVSKTGVFENVNITISYSKYNATSKQFESTNILPAGAGRYMASITYGGVTAGVEYTIKKATREAPEGLTVSPAGSVGGMGKINGTTSGTYNEVKAMEYNTSADAVTGWKDCSDGSTEVAPGTYYVRYKESRNYLASDVSAALTVKEHTHSGGNATCQKKAVCDGCGQEYGELGNHNFTETVSGMYLKSAATCQSPAVYYKSCLVCDKKSSETFEYGEKDFSNHIGNTYLVGQKEATCYAEGYTGDTYCSDCNEKIADGQSIAKNAHNPASVWTTDEHDHWKECQTVGCGNVIDKAAHSGGEATCVSKAVCEVCKAQYGDIDAANHKHTEIRDAKPATEQEKGYTGDTWCTDCNKKIATGSEIAMLEHKLTLVEVKDATVTEQGNIKYYYCENCGKYFADVAGTKEISLSETVIQKLPPEIIEGNNATVNNGEKKSLTFRSNAAFADFIRVELDGKTLDEKDYTKAEGSIIVTLNNDFVSTLSVGEHTLGIVSESGTATAKFTVKASEIPNESPKTGDDNMVAVWSLAAILSLAVLGFTTVGSKKKRAK